MRTRAGTINARRVIAVDGKVNRLGFDGGSDVTEGSLPWDSSKRSDELRERAARMVLDALSAPARAKGVIRRIADELDVHPEALRS